MVIRARRAPRVAIGVMGEAKISPAPAKISAQAIAQYSARVMVSVTCQPSFSAAILAANLVTASWYAASSPDRNSSVNAAQDCSSLAAAA